MRKKNYYFLLMFVMMNIMAVATSTVKAEAWDGTKRNVTITSADDKLILEFTPTETKSYTFKCDTEGYETKIKASWEGLSSPELSDPIYSGWAGSTLTVEAVADRVITLTVYAPYEADANGYPVTFPLELVADGGDGDDEPVAEPWDGTTKSVTIASVDDSKTFIYTATQNEMFYLFSKVSSYDVKFAGKVVDTPDSEFEGEAYDNLVGGYAAIKLWEGDKLQFTVTSTEFTDEENTDGKFPRKFNINSLAVPLGMGGSLPGSEYEFSSIKLQLDAETIIPVNEANHELNPFFVDYSELTWLSFTATETGLANIDIEEYVIFVYDDPDKIWMTDKDGNITYKPMRVVQDAEDNSHEFAVKAGTTYYVAITNNRPAKATLKFRKVDEGGECVLPIDITSETSTLSVKAGQTWYNYTMTKKEDSAFNILEFSSNNNWTGTVQYFVDCSDAEPVVHEIAAGAKSYFEMDTTRVNYLICVNSASAVTDAIKLVQRDPKAGESILNPQVAQLGDNTYGGEKRNYWYTYTTTKDCMLKITYPTNALTLITLGFGTTNVANPGETTCVVRVNAGEEYRMRFNVSDKNQASFKIEETEIPVGDYCDVPRLFNLNEDIVMKNRNAVEEWYAFTAPEDGVVEFQVEDPIWVRDYWSCGIVKECGGNQDKLKAEEAIGRLTYHYSVLKGEVYRFTVYQFTNGGTDIIIKTKFTPAGEGESCDKAISIDFDKAVICKDVASETWYEFVAPEAGEYYLVSSLGQGATLSYKVGDCSTEATIAAVKDFMYGRAYVTLNLEKDQIVKICAAISKDKPEDQDYDYSLIVRKKAQGDDLETPFAAKAGEYYTLGGGNVMTAATLEGYVYSITATDAKLEFTVLTKEAYFSGNFFVYYEGERIGFTPVKTRIDNEDGTYTYTYTLTNAAIETGKTYTVLFPFTVDGFNLGTSLITGIESTESVSKVIVCPNPSDGNFQVNLGELSAEGALIEVIDMAGVVIYKEYATSTIVSVNLKGITAGVYFVRVCADGKNAVAKLIVR